MSCITSLPCEVINTVLRHVGSRQNLFSAILSCQHFYKSFQENPHILVDIVQEQIGPALLPFAVAVMEASHLKPRNDETTKELLNQLQSEMEMPSTPRNRLLAMPLSRLAEMSYIHDIIHALVMAYANSAWKHLLSSSRSQLDGSGERRIADDSLSISPAEYLRFCRAFYRMQLYFRLFTGPADSRGNPDNDPAGVIISGASFLSKLPPWENEQLGSVLEFLELQFSKATRDVLAHDVEFGKWMVDYVYSGMLNFERQTWISQGVDFVYRLMNESSFDVKKEMLKSTRGSETSFLSRTLFSLYEELLEEDLTAMLETTNCMLVPFDPRHDADKGPFEAWCAANKSQPAYHVLFASINSGFRERAYVFWDEDRLQKHNILELFSGKAPESELFLEGARSEILAMGASIRARKKIWNQGGRGYWSKDDESRIVWTGQTSRD